jgi:amino acid transporter
MCEEVQNPQVQVPKAMVATIFINTFAGLLFLIPLMFVMPEIQDVIVSAQPVPLIIKSAVGSSGGAFGLLIPLIVLAIICGIGCTTASSRCAWAFARDGAIPGARMWSKVNTSLDVPLNAMMLCMVIEIILGVIYFGSSAAFNAFSGVGVICLTASYATPIAISLATGRKQVKTGQFYLGKFGAVANWIALGMYSSSSIVICLANSLLAWSLLAMPLFCMPSAIPVTAETVNYAPVVFVFACMVSGIWYWVWGHKNYAGPPTHED